MSTKNPIVISFDEHILKNQYISAKVPVWTLIKGVTEKYNKQNIPVVLMCGGYTDATQIIKTASEAALVGNVKKAHTLIKNVCKNHIDTVNSICNMYKIPSSDKNNILGHINDIHKKIEVLFFGVTKLRELSDKTRRLLKEYSFLLCIHVISTLFMLNKKHVKIFTGIDQIKNIASVSIVVPRSAKLDLHYDDALALCVKKVKTKRLDLWTQGNGVLTANDVDVPQAQSVKNISYEMALEVAYLGGNILHPSALQKVMYEGVTIDIYASNNFDEKKGHHTKYVTRISKNLQDKKIVLTDRDGFSLCTIHSANMFDAYGYLEKLFAICTAHKVSVETLTSSEISVTLTFKTESVTANFLKSLEEIGQVECKDKFSIVSVVGKQHWKDPAHVIYALKSLAKTKIATMSLGRNGSNLSLVLESKDVTRVLKALHKRLCETKSHKS